MSLLAMVGIWLVSETNSILGHDIASVGIHTCSITAAAPDPNVPSWKPYGCGTFVLKDGRAYDTQDRK